MIYFIALISVFTVVGIVHTCISISDSISNAIRESEEDRE